jgi:hypothetical protein
MGSRRCGSAASDVRPPGARLAAAETAPRAANHAEVMHIGRGGSDFMTGA